MVLDPTQLPSPAAPVCAGHSTPPVRHSQPHFTATQELSTQSLEAPFPPLPFKTHSSLEPSPPFSTPAPTQTDQPSQRTLRLMILLVSSSSSSESRRWFYFYCSPVLAPFFRSRPADDDVVCAWRFAWVRCARALPLSHTLFRLHFHSSPTYVALATPPM